VVIEDAEAAEAVEAEVEEAAEAIEIIKMPVIILVRTWTISNLSTLDMDIENVIRIIETRENIREVAVAAMAAVEVEEVEVIAEIPAGTTVRITIKITVKITVRITIINSRSIPARETRMEVTIEAAGIIIRIGGKAEEEEEAEFKVDGIRIAIIPMRIAINVAATTGEAEDNIEDVILHIFLTIAKVSHEKKERKL